MSKTVSKLALVAALVLAITFTFSCSSDDEGDNTPSSSSVEAQSGWSSSSDGDSQFSSSSSASTPPSSSSTSTEPLTCDAVPASGYATVQITPPALTCGNGQNAAGISWLGSPTINWNNPKEGTYSGISVMATCGTANNLMASCPGILTVQPMISCSMARTGYEGTAITPPVIACTDGSVPFDIVFSGFFPNWDNPAVGSYAVLAEANCGQGALPSISCGSLTVNEVTLTCGNVPASGYEGIAINPPVLTCSHSTTLGTPTWVNAPDWSNPAFDAYSDISATATCGLASKTASCSGSLSVSCTGKRNTSTHYCSNTTMNAYGFVTHGEQTYKTVVIGTQTWMAENLNYAVEGSKCYNNSSDNCATYGRLYDWSTAMNLASSCNSGSCSSQIQTKHSGICPVGWHIPSDAEWDVLMTAVGGSNTAGTKLKAVSGWKSGNGMDEYGFSALPGGWGGSGSLQGSFNEVGNFGQWWSATENNSFFAGNAQDWTMTSYNLSSVISGGLGIGKTNFLSVRCVQD